jgi:hypothetical protein
MKTCQGKLVKENLLTVHTRSGGEGKLVKEKLLVCTGLKAMLHLIFLATCNTILLLRDVN